MKVAKLARHPALTLIAQYSIKGLHTIMNCPSIHRLRAQRLSPKAAYMLSRHHGVLLAASDVAISAINGAVSMPACENIDIAYTN